MRFITAPTMSGSQSSFPGPDRSVTIEGLKSYRVSNRRYRNRRIGDFLKKLHLTAGRNTGFKKILNALEANGSPKPEFETDEDRSYFITRIFVHERFYEAEVDERNVIENVIDISEVWLTKRMPSYSKKKIAKAYEIVKLISENPKMSMNEMRKQLDVTERTIARYISDLKECGVVERIGADSGGSWKVLLK